MLLTDLPETIAGGWFIPSQSDDNHAYFVAPAKDSCNCSMHCSTCKCCPHMYHCSCVDFAVHHTVCKHVHTIHELRRHYVNETMAVTQPSTPNPTEEISDGETPCAVPNGSPVIENAAAASDSHTVESLRRVILSKCQQIMAATNVCDNKNALQCVFTHITAADASIRAITRARPRGLVLARKIAANKKLDIQRRFHSTKVKRRTLHSTLRKPSSLRVKELKGLMLGVNVESAISAVDDSSNLFEGCSQIPYCVDTEEV